MRQQPHRFLFLLLLLLVTLQVTAQSKRKDYLVVFIDTVTNKYGFADANGKTVIPAKYEMSFSDTLRTYAVVADSGNGLIAINQEDSVLYHVFNFDNGPDNAEEGLFRIVVNGKIGYADVKTGKVVIAPQFDCAYPFEAGKAKVSVSCTKKKEGEYEMWDSSNWYYINKKGSKVKPPRDGVTEQ